MPAIPGLTVLITIPGYSVIAKTELTFLQNELRQCVNIAISFPINRSSGPARSEPDRDTILPELINNAFNNRARHAAHGICNSIDRCVRLSGSPDASESRGDEVAAKEFPLIDNRRWNSRGHVRFYRSFSRPDIKYKDVHSPETSGEFPRHPSCRL